MGRKLARRGDLVGVGVLLFIVLQIAGSFLLSALQGGWGEGSTTFALFRLVVSALLLALPFLFLLRRGRPLGLRLPIKCPALPLGVMLPLFLLAMLALNFAMGTLREAWHMWAGTKSPGSSALPGNGAAIWLLFFSSCVLPAVFEELLFRGAIHGLLVPYGERVAVFVTALLFALMHTFGWDTPTVFCLGILLGFARQVGGSVWPCMVLHFSNNLVAFLTLLLQAYASAWVWRFTAFLWAAALLGSGAAVWYLAQNRFLGRLFLKREKDQANGLARLSHAPFFVAALLFGAVYCVGRAVA